MANSELAIQNAKEALGRGDFDTASQDWSKAKVYWPENPELQSVATRLRDLFAQRQYEKFEAALDAGRVDEALKLRQNFAFDDGTSPRLEELKRRADASLQREKDYLDLLKKVEELQRSNRFFSAEELIAKAPSNVALRSKVVEQKEVLARAIRKIRNELAEASRESDLALKERKFYDLTQLYPDFEEAKKALESLPPAPPRDIQARSNAEGIEILWRPSPSLGALVYRVERFPVDCSENERGRRAVVVCEGTRECAFVDSTVEDFERYVYETTACSELGLASPSVQSEIALRLGEARNVVVNSEANSLKITWKISPKVDGVVVYRKDLTRPNEARVRVESVGIAGFVDGGLENEREYEYDVALRYRDVDGSLQTTYPQRFKGIPCEQLSPVDDLKVSCANNGLALTWTAPKKGDVRFWVLPKSSGFSRGETYRGSEQELSKKLNAEPTLCRINATDAQGRTSGTIARQNGGALHCVVLPATSDGVRFTFGKEREVYALEPATNIVSQIADGCAYFSWNWPSNAVQAFIFENPVEPPREENYSKCKRYALSRYEYECENAWKRSISNASSYYFKIFMVYRIDGKDRYSQGVDFRNRRGYVEYRKIEPRKSNGVLSRLFSKRKAASETILQFNAINGNTYIPEVCVVRQWNRPPLRRDDGDVIVDSLGPSETGTLELRLNEYFEPRAFYRCYLKNREDAANFALLDPPDEDLRLYDAEKY